MQTTLNKIKLHSPCGDGWKNLLNHLNKNEADDEVLELRTILDCNGLDDTLWAFRAVEGRDKKIRLFAADCAELVLHIFEEQYPNDDRPRKAIQAARDYANGLINLEELASASDVARAASASARAAAWASASYAARAAAWASASYAAWDAAWAAARAAGADAWAARDAAWASASYAAWAAARDASDAAWAAARDARDAARDAASASVSDAANDAARDEIKSLLLKYI